MPSNLGLIQQRCVKKIMEHVDTKTTNRDDQDQGMSYHCNSTMIELLFELTGLINLVS